MRFDLFSKGLPLGVVIEKLIDMGYKVKQDKDYTIKWVELGDQNEVEILSSIFECEITVSESVITGKPLLIFNHV